MKISFADFYKNNISDEKLSEIKNFLNHKKISFNKNKLDEFLNSLKKETVKKFKIDKIDFPYYHYYPNPVYKKEEILIDVSINDKLNWQLYFKKDDLTIPKELKNLLTKYQKLSTKEPITFDTGYYRTKSQKTRKIEENFMLLADRYFDRLQKILKSSHNWQNKADVAFLISYAVKNEKSAIHALINALKDNDHAVHNGTARSLFPKIFVKKADIWFLQDLLYHHNPYCQNKFLGAAANIDLTAKDKKKLQSMKLDIKKKTKYSQMIASYAAKALMDKLE